MMEDDPLQEIRRIRRDISDACGEDVDKILAYYQRHEETAIRAGRARFVDAPLRAAQSVTQNGTAGKAAQ